MSEQTPVIEHKDHFHGSDLEKIEEIYGIKKEDITSFSANVNPLGISPKLKEALAEHIDVITSYPDRELHLSSQEHCPVYPHRRVPHHRGQRRHGADLSFIQIEHPKKALIIGPSYSEYEREIELGGGTALYYPLKEANDFALDVPHFLGKLNETIDLLVICNPNNPTSTAINRADMRRILDECKSYGIYVMVDETYVEFAPDTDALTSIPLSHIYSNLIILRGISKFFASPGLRLGYAVTGNQDSDQGDQWPEKSVDHQFWPKVAGELMFSDEDYIRETRALIGEERTRIYGILSGYGIHSRCTNPPPTSCWPAF